MTSTATSAAHRASPALFLALTLAAALTAALAAGLSARLALPVWAMFVGWVAFFTRGLTARDGAVNAACVLLGLRRRRALSRHARHVCAQRRGGGMHHACEPRRARPLLPSRAGSP